MVQPFLTAQGAQAALVVEDGIFLCIPAQDNLRLPVERFAGGGTVPYHFCGLVFAVRPV